MFFMGAGTSLYVISTLPALPFDTFTRDISSYFQKPFKLVRTTCDLVFVSISIVISLILRRLTGIGPGTILFALFFGTVVHSYSEWFTSRYVFKPVLKPVQKLMQLGDRFNISHSAKKSASDLTKN